MDVRGLFLVGLAACGGSSTKNREPVGNRAPPPPKPTCTTERVDAIAKALQRRWKSEEAPLVHCTPGLFPTAGFVIEATVDGIRHAGVLHAETDRELVAIAPEPVRPIATSIVDRATVDLDGDGVDEIVETWRRSSHGAMGSDTWLEIRIADGERLHTIQGPHTSVYHPELGGCRGDVRLAGKTLVVVVENLIGIPPSDCLREGTHSFALDGEQLVEIDARRLSRR